MTNIGSTSRGNSISEKFNEGHTSGFDYLRLILAISVLSVHSFSMAQGKSIETIVYGPPLRGITGLILPMFFALSGFLVTASLFRTRNIFQFLGLRALRLVPALFVEVLLSAFILGPIFTDLPLSTYFSDSKFWSYFLNIVGQIHYNLPGVFLDNPYFATVNASLWTIPGELSCYIALTALAITRVVKKRYLLLGVIVAWHLFILYQDITFDHHWIPARPMPSRMLLLCFLVGVLLFVFRESIRVTTPSIAIALLLSFIMLNLPFTPHFASFPIAYATVGLGLLKGPKNWLISSGDYSYGIYLYAFPMQQMFAHLFPDLRVWYMNILFALPTTFLFAAFSWHSVEKHALKLRQYLRKSKV